MKKYVALYCREDSAYKDRSSWSVFDKKRDARSYDGNNPVVCHPPCRAWSWLLQAHSFRNCDNPHLERAKEMHLALHAFEQVYRVGGIIEHPQTSRLWSIGNMQNGMLITINQGDFGHPYSKPTKLFIYPRITLPKLPMPTVKELKSINNASGGSYWRDATPEKMIDWFELVLDQIIQHHVEATHS